MVNTPRVDPAFLHSLYFTLYYTDITLRWTFGDCPKVSFDTVFTVNQTQHSSVFKFHGISRHQEVE